MSRQTLQCAQCKEWEEPGPTAGCYRGTWMCSIKCMHDAGDRGVCRAGTCGCTGYAIKRRLLREHRAEMRVMQDLIDAEELGEQLERDLAEAGIGTQFCLGDIPEMDEDSDEPDPEQGLRDEAKDQSNMVEAATAIAEAQQLRLDLERARMKAEDLRAHL